MGSARRRFRAVNPGGLRLVTAGSYMPAKGQHFAERDVFAFLAEGEGFGMPVLEALLCGCVPVVVDSGPLREVVGDAGLVVRRDGAAVGRALADLAADRARLASLSRGRPRGRRPGAARRLRSPSAAGPRRSARPRTARCRAMVWPRTRLVSSASAGVTVPGGSP